MAVFNGERYLGDQLRSILDQISVDDEVIIVDDCSEDGSLALIQSMNDRRITVVCNNSNLGPSLSFQRAICLAKGEYIFLSDQDDIWNSSKVEIIRQIFDSTDSLLIVSDARVVDSDRRLLFSSMFEWRGSRAGFWRNLYKNGFVGCCMALRAEVKQFILPFPIRVGMHDEWIGLCASIAGRVDFIQQKLIDYRRHERNVTQLDHGSIASMVRKRLNGLTIVMSRLPRIMYWRIRRIC